MRPLTGSFIGTIAGFLPPQYKFSDDLSHVEVAGFVETPGATGNYNSTVFFTFPPAYRPNNANSTNSYKWMTTGVPDGLATPVVGVLPNGTMFMNFLPSSLAQTVIGIFGRFPIDTQYGMIQS
jgi:hypothetical protein